MRTKTTGRSRVLRVLVAVCVAVGLSAAPGVAAAADGSVTPVAECYKANANGTYTIVLGYTNASNRTITLGYGDKNVISPARYQGTQPKVFKPGTQRGVFSLTVTTADYYGGMRWSLDGTVIDSRTTWAPACAPSTPLPLLGNGTGLAIALVVGGLFGVLFVRRIIRRAGARRPLTPGEGT